MRMLGAQIDDLGTSRLSITGVAALGGGEFTFCRRWKPRAHPHFVENICSLGARIEWMEEKWAVALLE